MRSYIRGACLLSWSVAFAQPPAGTVAFEVASIKPSKSQPMGLMRIGMNVDGAMLRYTNVSLRDCIRIAYRIKEFQVQGPDWLSSERFDIVAKLPAGASEDQVPEMLQALLAERFKLAFDRNTKEHPIYALVAAKNGPKLKPAEIQTAAGQRPDRIRESGPVPRGAMSMMVGPDGAHLKTPSATLGTLAEMISRFSERPVVDMTGIDGQYEFDLVFTPETMRNMPGGMRGPMGPPPGGGENPPADPPAERAGSIYDSVQRYGLKLESRKAQMEILVVKHIERAPTEN